MRGEPDGHSLAMARALHKDPTVGICLGLYVGHGGGGAVSCERGNPVSVPEFSLLNFEIRQQHPFSCAQQRAFPPDRELLIDEPTGPDPLNCRDDFE